MNAMDPMGGLVPLADRLVHLLDYYNASALRNLLMYARYDVLKALGRGIDDAIVRKHGLGTPPDWELGGAAPKRPGFMCSEGYLYDVETGRCIKKSPSPTRWQMQGLSRPPRWK